MVGLVLFCVVGLVLCCRTDSGVVGLVLCSRTAVWFCVVGLVRFRSMFYVVGLHSGSV